MVLLLLSDVIHSFLLVFLFFGICRMTLHIFLHLLLVLSNNIFPWFSRMLLLFQNVLIIYDRASYIVLLLIPIFLLLVIVFLSSFYIKLLLLIHFLFFHLFLDVPSFLRSLMLFPNFL